MKSVPSVLSVVPIPGAAATFNVELSDGRGYVARMLPPDRLKLHAASTGMKVNLKEQVHARILNAIKGVSGVRA